jgi:hypothetical protein
MPNYIVIYAGKRKVKAPNEAEAIQRARWDIPCSDFQIVAVVDPDQTEIEFNVPRDKNQ